MPTLEENRSIWDARYDWKDEGEEWSHAWGSSTMQWYGTLLPRIHTFLPAHAILEIAPGYGRWTRFLKDYCNHLTIVDLSEKCIQECEKRFSNCSNITYFVNDGKSLEMIPDNSIDFIFSFDSLVHAEDKVISDYVSQFPHKLTQNGVAFIHHSNLGAYTKTLLIYDKLRRSPKLLDFLTNLGLIDNISRPMRDPSMTANKMQLYAQENGLKCISQELILWETKRSLTDCISTIVKQDSIWTRDNEILQNFHLMNEAKNLSNLRKLYEYRSR